jgi:hypothetical protein
MDLRSQYIQLLKLTRFQFELAVQEMDTVQSCLLEDHVSVIIRRTAVQLSVSQQKF